MSAGGKDWIRKIRGNERTESEVGGVWWPEMGTNRETELHVRKSVLGGGWHLAQRPVGRDVLYSEEGSRGEQESNVRQHDRNGRTSQSWKVRGEPGRGEHKHLYSGASPSCSASSFLSGHSIGMPACSDRSRLKPKQNSPQNLPGPSVPMQLLFHFSALCHSQILMSVTRVSALSPASLQ